MPSPEFVNKIQEALAPNERYQDFAQLFDMLVSLRRPLHQNQEENETVVGWLECLFTPDKPANYVQAMQQFRVRYAGVANDPALQAEFANCINPAAIYVSRPQDLVWQPSLYFSLSNRLHGNLEGWF